MSDQGHKHSHNIYSESETRTGDARHAQPKTNENSYPHFHEDVKKAAWGTAGFARKDV